MQKIPHVFAQVFPPTSIFNVFLLFTNQIALHSNQREILPQKSEHDLAPCGIIPNQLPKSTTKQEVGKFKDMFIYVNAMNNDEYTYTDYTTLDPVGICKFEENHNPTHQQRTNLRPPNLSLMSSSGPSTKAWIKVLKFSSAKTEMPGNGSARRELNSIPGGWGWLMLVDVGPLNP